MSWLRHYILLLSLCLLISACKDKSLHPDLPPATHKGANTLGFKVNGENWVPDYTSIDLNGRREIDMNYSKETQRFYIDANRKIKNVDQNISFVLTNLSSEKDYFNKENIESLELYDYSKASFIFYIQTFQNGHFLITKLDTVNQIISGTFDFTLLNGDGEEVHITGGRFDFHYPYVK